MTVVHVAFMISTLPAPGLPHRYPRLAVLLEGAAARVLRDSAARDAAPALDDEQARQGCVRHEGCLVRGSIPAAASIGAVLADVHRR